MRIVEIFSSLQGEGMNSGVLVTFVRLQGCNLNCWFCDTTFDEGEYYTIEELAAVLEEKGIRRIIWTGGEPTLQLTKEIVQYFKSLGYWQAIETNGTARPPEGLDYISVSPKVSVEVLRENFEGIVIDEIRYPIGEDTVPPNIDDLPQSRNYLLSPIFLGENKERLLMSSSNLTHSLDLIHKDSRWRLSLQLHKLIGIQ